jgi:ribosomal protein S18 acetylase RimI-like enzyme
MTIAELDDVAIRRIVTHEERVQWRPGFIGAYQTVFGGSPYFERWFPAEAEGVWRHLNSVPGNIVLLATRGDSQVVGFGVGIPLLGKPSVAAHLSGLVPLKHTFYLAELGVLEPYRARGIGRTLVRARLRHVDPTTYSHIVLRVSMNHGPSWEMYKAMGFDEMGVTMDVSALRVDGKVTTDRRRFMAKVLSQVSLD